MKNLSKNLKAAKLVPTAISLQSLKNEFYFKIKNTVMARPGVKRIKNQEITLDQLFCDSRTIKISDAKEFEKLSDSDRQKYQLNETILTSHQDWSYVFSLLENGHDRTVLQAHLRRQNYDKPLPQTINKINWLQVNGEAGVGKSSLLYGLFQMLFSAQSKHKYLPVLIDLSSAEDFNAFYADYQNSYTPNPYIENLIDKLNFIQTLGYTPLLLIDGIDVPISTANKEQTKELFLNNLKNLVHKALPTERNIPDFKILSLGRKYESENVLATTPDFSVDLEALSKVELIQMLQNYLKVYYAEKAYSPEELQKEAEALVERKDLSELMQNPLLLNMLLASYSPHELNDIQGIKREDIFQQYWKEIIEIKYYTNGTKLKDPVRAEIVKILGDHIINSQNISYGEDTDIRERIIHELKLESERVDGYLEDLKHDNIIVRGKNIIFHDAFLTYAAAKYLNDKPDRGKRKQLKDKLMRNIYAFNENGRQKDAFVEYVLMTSSEEREEILNELLNEGIVNFSGTTLKLPDEASLDIAAKAFCRIEGTLSPKENIILTKYFKIIHTYLLTNLNIANSSKIRIFFNISPLPYLKHLNKYDEELLKTLVKMLKISTLDKFKMHLKDISDIFLIAIKNLIIAPEKFIMDILGFLDAKQNNPEENILNNSMSPEEQATFNTYNLLGSIPSEQEINNIFIDVIASLAEKIKEKPLEHLLNFKNMFIRYKHLSPELSAAISHVAKNIYEPHEKLAIDLYDLLTSGEYSFSVAEELAAAISTQAIYFNGGIAGYVSRQVNLLRSKKYSNEYIERITMAIAHISKYIEDNQSGPILDLIEIIRFKDFSEIVKENAAKAIANISEKITYKPQDTIFKLLELIEKERPGINISDILAKAILILTENINNDHEAVILGIIKILQLNTFHKGLIENLTKSIKNLSVNINGTPKLIYALLELVQHEEYIYDGTTNLTEAINNISLNIQKNEDYELFALTYSRPFIFDLYPDNVTIALTMLYIRLNINHKPYKEFVLELIDIFKTKYYPTNNILKLPDILQNIAKEIPGEHNLIISDLLSLFKSMDSSDDTKGRLLGIITFFGENMQINHLQFIFELIEILKLNLDNKKIVEDILCSIYTLIPNIEDGHREIMLDLIRMLKSKYFYPRLPYIFTQLLTNISDDIHGYQEDIFLDFIEMIKTGNYHGLDSFNITQIAYKLTKNVSHQKQNIMFNVIDALKSCLSDINNNQDKNDLIKYLVEIMESLGIMFNEKQCIELIETVVAHSTINQDSPYIVNDLLHICNTSKEHKVMISLKYSKKDIFYNNLCRYAFRDNRIRASLLKEHAETGMTLELLKKILQANDELTFNKGERFYIDSSTGRGNTLIQMLDFVEKNIPGDVKVHPKNFEKIREFLDNYASDTNFETDLLELMEIIQKPKDPYAMFFQRMKEIYIKYNEGRQHQWNNERYRKLIYG